MGYQSTAPVDLTAAWVKIADANQLVLLQRVSGYDVIYQIAEDEPDEESTDGHSLNDYAPRELKAQNPIWARSVAESVLLVTLAGVSAETSKENPLPTALDAKTSTLQATLEGKNFYYKLTAAAMAAKYTALQIWNPVGSGVTLIVNPVTGLNSTGTMTWTRIKSAAQLATVAGYSKNHNFNLNNTSKAELRYSHLNSLTVAEDLGSPSIAASTGIGVSVTNNTVVLGEGQGIQFEGNTQWVGMSISGVITEYEN